MVLTAPYFSAQWFDRGLAAYTTQALRLKFFLNNYPHQQREEYRLMSQTAFSLIVLQKQMMWMDYMKRHNFPVITDFMNVAFQEVQMRSQLRTAQIRLEIGNEVTVLKLFKKPKFHDNLCNPSVILQQIFCVYFDFLSTLSVAETLHF